MFFVNLGIIAVTLRQLVSIIKICRAKVIPTLKMPFVVSSQLLHYLYAKNNEWEKNVVDRLSQVKPVPSRFS